MPPRGWGAPLTAGKAAGYLSTTNRFSGESYWATWTKFLEPTGILIRSTFNCLLVPGVDVVEAVSRRTRRSAVSAVSLVGARLGVLPVESTNVVPAGVREDFNGYGYGDLAVSAPCTAASGKAEAGDAFAADLARRRDRTVLPGGTGGFTSGKVLPAVFLGASTLGAVASGAWLGDALPR